MPGIVKAGNSDLGGESVLASPDIRNPLNEMFLESGPEA